MKLKTSKGVKIAFTTNKDVDLAVKEISESIKTNDVKLLVYFASSNYEQEKLAKMMDEEFADIELYGCSTAGEIISGKMLNNSIVAMAFDNSYISDMKIELVEDIKGKCDIKSTFNSFEQYFKTSMLEADINKFFGLVLIDGLSKAEEKVMDKIGDLTNCLFIGGSAGDDLKFQHTSIYFKGKVYENAALIAFIKSDRKFDFIKTQSFCALDKKLLATKVNQETREVIEFNNKPAVEEYARVLGIEKDKLKEYFMSNPLGLVIDKEIYVRSPQQINEDKIIFYCNILEGMEVNILESSDIINETKNSIQQKLKELGSISCIINFNCILRTLEIQALKKEDEYGMVFNDIPTIGFSTYGEEYLGHINQTATMIVFE